jgi:hypothetical protein
MQMPSLRPRFRTFLFGIATLTLCGWAAAEPPSRAARLSDISGTVSFSPAGEPDWVQAVANRPLTTGDRLWVDENSHAELQVGGAAIRLGGATSVTLLNLDDRMVQLQLSEGALRVRVRRMGPNQAFEVDTPNLAFSLRRPGEFRINVDPADDATAIMMQSGRAEVYGEGDSYAVNPQQAYRFYGTGLSDYDRLGASRDDDLDRWARQRDRRLDDSRSARYVSSEVVGYEDLDAGGTWRTDPNYGNVWTPNRVAADWSPYRDGHWAWIDPWGWTWVDDAPWGYAVSHYGRWANIGGSWGWVPGPPREQAVYAPALVAFVGGTQTSSAIVGWFPLAPREVYQPSYQVSRGYFDNINRSNAVIAPATITNVYNTINVTNVTNSTTVVNNAPSVSRVVYANQRVAGAVVAMPAQAFAQSQPVAKVAVPLSKDAAISAPVSRVAAVAPVQQSVHGGAPTVGAKPPARERAVVAHTAPPPPPVAFAVQHEQLAAKPGMPINEAQRSQLKPAVTAAPRISVVTAAQAPAPTAPPPATAPAAKSPDARRAAAARPDTAKPDEGKAAPGRPEAPAKADSARVDAAKADAAKAEAAKADAAKVEAAKAASANAEAAAKAQAAKAASTNAEAARANAARAEAAARSEAARTEAARSEAARAEAAKAASAKADAARADAAKADAARAEAAAKAEATAQAEAARADAAKAASARVDAVRAEAAKADAAKADAARAEAARAEAAKAASAKAEAARIDSARAAAAKNEAARADAAKAAEAAVRAEAAAKAEAAARANAATKAEAARADAAKAAAAKSEAPRAEAAKAPPARPVKPKTEAELKAEEEKKAAEEARKR